MPITKEIFRKVLGHFATGVTVVTMRHPSGGPWGFTVNAFTSVSLDPPLVLVCVDHGTESFRAMTGAEYFAVNFLSEQQEAISCVFASRGADRFSGVEYRESPHGSPLLDGCVGFIECKVTGSHVAGDHTIIIGEVLEAQASGGAPLLFYAGAYGRMGSPGDGNGSKG